MEHHCTVIIRNGIISEKPGNTHMYWYRIDEQNQENNLYINVYIYIYICIMYNNTYNRKATLKDLRSLITAITNHNFLHEQCYLQEKQNRVWTFYTANVGTYFVLLWVFLQGFPPTTEKEIKSFYWKNKNFKNLQVCPSPVVWYSTVLHNLSKTVNDR